MSGAFAVDVHEIAHKMGITVEYRDLPLTTTSLLVVRGAKRTLTLAGHAAKVNQRHAIARAIYRVQNASKRSFDVIEEQDSNPDDWWDALLYADELMLPEHVMRGLVMAGGNAISIASVCGMSLHAAARRMQSFGLQALDFTSDDEDASEQVAPPDPQRGILGRLGLGR